ncbi:hypothetical protein N9L68_06965 [bacterium]|nr:hypothetical protein [bacterium]
MFKDSHLPSDAESAARAGELLPFIGVIGKTHMGGWEWLKNACGLCGWKDTADGKCCFSCGADREEFPWTDPSLGAMWRSTIFTTR